MKKDGIRVVYDSELDNGGYGINHVADMLNVPVGGCIIAFGEVGRWDGRHNGCKILGHNLRSVLDWNGYDSVRITVENGDLKGVLKHHDGTHYLTFRKIKARANTLKVMNAVLGGDDIESFTTSLKRYVPKEIKG